MYYLIDGNNLAGDLGLLEESDFNEILIDLLKDFLEDNRKKVTLVFDSNSQMGDSYEEDRLKVVYSPRDVHYASADDKIVEIAREEDPDEGIVLVTNDNEIKDEVGIINKEQNRKNEIILVSSSDFKMELGEEEVVSSNGDDELEEDEVAEINDELMSEWG
ncbi:MAG: NYN domain-containing protein [Patescibacteria group bacterium]|jgi:predicted RNA-binding protein with PIN domain|nr:NYN domain-containing protein [Patescibacteria group bacterium]